MQPKYVWESTAERIRDKSIVSSIRLKFDDRFFVDLCILYELQRKIVFVLICRTDRTISGSLFFTKQVNQQRIGDQILA